MSVSVGLRQRAELREGWVLAYALAEEVLVELARHWKRARDRLGYGGHGGWSYQVVLAGCGVVC